MAIPLLVIVPVAAGLVWLERATRPKKAPPATTEPIEEPPPTGEPPVRTGLVGWRTMSLSEAHDGLVCRGVLRGELRTRESPPADCVGEHPVPDWDDTCGHYAVYEKPETWRGADVLLEVSAAGRTVLCEDGFRTQRYRVDEIRIRPELLGRKEALERQFGVPVIVEGQA